MSLSWTPVQRGAVYCSPACGHNCTVADHARAKLRAANLATACGPKWRTRVWENLGWYYGAVSPCGLMQVYEHRNKQSRHATYTAYFVHGEFVGRGVTPGAAIEHAVKQATDEATRLTGAVTTFTLTRAFS